MNPRQLKGIISASSIFRSFHSSDDKSVAHCWQAEPVSKLSDGREVHALTESLVTLPAATGEFSRKASFVIEGF